ncbi:MAG: 16S rRNA (cytidine(1402)-2'-O)-methyltransferase [Candidatus Omnitrophica bacterium]|nr:16S rRNA (cytidine(1402)-2'-O)-methyltransferase [Candidatus Omnitrophota bacterium]
MNGSSGTLYVVATPIGNLKDITLRAIDTLKQASLIACEDTRHTKKLTAHYGIETPVTSYFQYSPAAKSQHIIDVLKQGKSVALVSDAGTPGISDPGYRLIKEAIDNNINVTIIPGASAIISALVISGLPTDRFLFEGFLSNKSGQRRKRLEFFKDETRTVIFYESPHRLLKCLKDMQNVFGDITAVCAREITKKFEEVKRANLSVLIEHFSKQTPLGEFVILINPKIK